jgi:hypothetical protein
MKGKGPVLLVSVLIGFCGGLLHRGATLLSAQASSGDRMAGYIPPVPNPPLYRTPAKGDPLEH